jgi:hypothetical protein
MGDQMLSVNAATITRRECLMHESARDIDIIRRKLL